MDTGDLRALLDVVHHGSFQAAATALRVPRTRLRRSIDRLEESLGARLLHREVRGIQLTLAGVELVERGAQVLAAEDAAIAAVRTAEGGPATLRLVVPAGLPLRLRVQALLNLPALAPGLGLEVFEIDDPLSLASSAFDVLIHTGERIQREGVYSRVAQRVEVGLYAAPAYLARTAPPTGARDLRAHTLLLWDLATPRRSAVPLLDGGELPVHPLLSSGNESLVRAVTAEGGGIGLLPRAGHPLFDTHGDPELVPVLPDEVGGSVTFRIVSRKSRREDHAIAAMLENLDRMLGHLLGPAEPEG